MSLPTTGWFVRKLDDGTTQLWHFRGDQAVHAGVSSAQRGIGSIIDALPGETIWEAIGRCTPWLEGQDGMGPFMPVDNDAGLYHPRMARPVHGYGTGWSFLPGDEDYRRYLRNGQTQLEALVGDIEAIARVVEPTGATLCVHGHAIRNLLILAATEVEMHFRSVLTANGVDASRSQTGDFIKLASPMRLRDYSVRFLKYPDIPLLTPFVGWKAQCPTQSLTWYDAYNGVKHNRDVEFERASLGNALHAVAACAILLVSQFGEDGVSEELRRFLAIDLPAWPVADMYVAPMDPAGWVPNPHPDLG